MELKEKAEIVSGQDMTGPFRILFLEDNLYDVQLMQNAIDKAELRYESEVLWMKKDFVNRLKEAPPDIVLADYYLPSYNGMQAFQLLRQHHLYVPFILVTGTLSEQLALECLNEGVDDFILKSSFRRLPVAIANAIKKKNIEKERLRMAEELKKSHEELRLLNIAQQTAREDERLSIARDLHDELGQVLTALKIDITMFGKKLLPKAEEPGLEQEFKSILNLVDRTTQSVKRISSGLRPEVLDELGLIEAVRWLAKEFQERNRIRCITSLTSKSIAGGKDFPIAVYRIVQEALTNVARHAEASEVKIELKVEGETLHLEIADNGKGISEKRIRSSTSLGLIGLRERVSALNGKFSIMGGRERGTVILASIPIGHAGRAASVVAHPALNGSSS